MSVRRTALEALLDITERGAYANLRLKEALSALDERDAKWVSAAVYTTLDHLLYIDYVIDHFAKGRIKPQIRGVLRLGACQALYMNVPDSAACDESVKLAKEIGKGALAGYVNGVMRSILRSRDALPKLPSDPRERLSIQYSYPRYIVDEYVGMYGVGFTEAMLAHEERGMTVRAQYPFTSAELEAELNGRGAQYERGELVSDAFKLKKGFDVASEPLFNAGKITVQSESAMLVCRALGPTPEMKILDACAAPGGKSAYIASLTKNCAQIDAWELHEHRAELMRKTLERLNAHASVRVCDAAVRHDECIEKYDAVLVDAPCSGLGVPGKPDARYAKSSDMIEELAQLQRSILDACAAYVKRGGTLVYATCTISSRENEKQIAAFLERHEEFEPAQISDILPMQLWRSVYGCNMIQLFPHRDGTEGFFLAKMKRR